MARWSYQADAGRSERLRNKKGNDWGLPLYPRAAYYWRRYATLPDCVKRWSIDHPIAPSLNCGVYLLPPDTEPRAVIIIGLTGGVTTVHVDEGRLITNWSESWEAFRTEPRRTGSFPVAVTQSVPSASGSFDFRRYYERLKVKGPSAVHKLRIELKEKATTMRAASSHMSPESLATVRLRLKAIDAELSLLDWLIEAGLAIRKRTLGPKLARLFLVGPREGKTMKSEIEGLAATKIESGADTSISADAVRDDAALTRYLLHEWKTLFIPLAVAYSKPAEFFNKIVMPVDSEFLDREVEDVLWTWGCGALLNRRVSDKWLKASAEVHQAAIESVELRGSYEDGRHPTDAGVTDETKAIADEADVVWKILGGTSGYAGDTEAERRIYERYREPIEAFRRKGTKRGRREAADEIVGKFHRLSGGAVKKGRQRRNKDAKPRVVLDPTKKT